MERREVQVQRVVGGKATGRNAALHDLECVGEPRVEFGVAQHIGVLAGTR